MQVRIFEQRFIEVGRVAKQRIAKAEVGCLCLACMEPLDGRKPIRGNHPRCFYAQYRAIESGKTTDKELVETGRRAPKQKPGRRPSNPVTIELANR